MTGAPRESWSEWNQRWLVASLDELRRQLEARAVDSSSDPTSIIKSVDEESDRFTPALLRCTRLFGLSPFECELLLLAAGLELHEGLRSAIATLNGGSASVSFGLALAVLADPHWDALSPDAPLRRWGLINVETGAPLTQAALRVDERVTHFLTGVAATDARLRGVVDVVEPRGVDVDENDEAAVARVANAIAHDDVPGPIVVVRSEPHDAAAECGVTLAALARRARVALWIAAHDLPADAGELATVARLVDREAALTGGVPVLWLAEGASERTGVSFVSRIRSPLVWFGGASFTPAPTPGGRRAVVRVDLSPASVATTVSTLRARWNRSAPATNGDHSAIAALERAASQFRLAPAMIDEIVTRVRAAEPAHRDAVAWAAARQASRGGLETLAQRIVTTARFEDLVLPPVQLAALRDIARQLRHRERVYRDWGFGVRHTRGQGLTALFAGESGTGKTLAAEAIANEVELDLYRVDLATVVSKYIGETEKNLKRLFDAAEASGAVLLFDEADAIFGKRSEVKDSHDRYANIEVAYLLQRVEAYRGLAVLTTNMKSALDRSFLRRLRFVVHFPFPDARAREQIWRREFPVAAPLGTIDFGALAKLNVAGGSIHGIALNAAFKAADGDGVIDQGILMAAARVEFAKLERPVGSAAAERT